MQRVEIPHIARAPAYMVSDRHQDRLIQVLRRWLVSQFVEKQLCRHHKTWCAIAALEGEMAEEGLLYGRELRPCGDTLDCGDRTTLQSGKRSRATSHGGSRRVRRFRHGHGACPADA